INQEEPVKGDNRNNRQNKPPQQTRNQNQSMHKVMPQYGHKHQIHSIEQDQSSEEIVIEVDVKKQNAIAERRVFNWLCRSFPDCFNPKAKKPLKIGISDDIQAQYNQVYGVPVDQFILSRVLKRYVGDQNYQKSVIEHKQRFDLNGKPVEDFTEAHLEHAAKRLEELKFKANLRAQGIDIRQYYEEKAKNEAAEREKQELENKDSENNISIEDDSDNEYDSSKELND
ncbi:ProQ/FINO family protein, partial [Francisellaceae bacterium]|nr:ProQ/FINO family protein [Francisellaceae bacterium]